MKTALNRTFIRSSEYKMKMDNKNIAKLQVTSIVILEK